MSWLYLPSSALPASGCLVRDCEPGAPAPRSNDAMYEAWHKVGADIAGLKFEDFIAALGSAAPAPQPQDLTMWGYSDEDEYMGDTLDEYAKQRGFCIGDSFDVTEGWSRERSFEIVGGGPTAGNPKGEFVFKALDSIAAPVPAGGITEEFNATATDPSELLADLRADNKHYAANFIEALLSRSNAPQPEAAQPEPITIDERKEFDKWHIRYGKGFTVYSEFNSVELTAAWKAWQARAALLLQSPSDSRDHIISLLRSTLYALAKGKLNANELRSAAMEAYEASALQSQPAQQTEIEPKSVTQARGKIAERKAALPSFVAPLQSQPVQPCEYERGFKDGQEKVDVFRQRALKAEAQLVANAVAMLDAAQSAPSTAVPDIKEMVNRFLCWKLPTDFYPDCGISFDGRKDDEWNKNKTWPIGTNLFSADQAKAMFEYCLREGLKPFGQRTAAEAVAAWKSITPAAPSGDAKDAERYRWLRHADLDALAAANWGSGGEVYTGEMFDAAIDAAMQQTNAATDGGE